MSDLNLVMIEGRLGDDPKVSRQGRRCHARCRVATNRRWKGDDGEWNERATWHLVVAFDAAAEQIALLRKGDGIFVRGELNVREYITSDEVVRYEHQIVAHDVRAPLKILAAGAEVQRPSTGSSRSERGPARTPAGSPRSDGWESRQERRDAPQPVQHQPVRERAGVHQPRPAPQAEDEIPVEDVFGELEQAIYSGGDQ